MGEPNNEERFDFVIFGATGYTGQCVVEYLARAIEEERIKNPKEPLTFAVSGRNLVQVAQRPRKRLLEHQPETE